MMCFLQRNNQLDKLELEKARQQINVINNIECPNFFDDGQTNILNKQDFLFMPFSF